MTTTGGLVHGWLSRWALAWKQSSKVCGYRHGSRIIPSSLASGR
jgi:hypothetical protein